MKKTIIVIIILLIVGALFWMFKSKTNVTILPSLDTPTTQNQADDTEITTINKDIESIDVGNTDQDFKDINTDLQGL